jgi:hypothetical protein
MGKKTSEKADDNLSEFEVGDRVKVRFLWFARSSREIDDRRCCAARHSIERGDFSGRSVRAPAAGAGRKNGSCEVGNSSGASALWLSRNIFLQDIIVKLRCFVIERAKSVRRVTACARSTALGRPNGASRARAGRQRRPFFREGRTCGRSSPTSSAVSPPRVSSSSP